MTAQSNSTEPETGEQPERCWVEWGTQHAFRVNPAPYVETVEYARAYDAHGWPTEAGAEATLRESGSSGKEVINGFIDQLLRERAELERERDALREEVTRLKKLIDTPHTDDWLQAVPLEAAHQIKRWGVEHDVGKTPFDWFWLIGYLSQKAALSAVAGDIEKAKHHTVSTGAVLLNWFRRLTGDDESFQPGIDPPQRGADAALGEIK